MELLDLGDGRQYGKQIYVESEPDGTLSIAVYDGDDTAANLTRSEVIALRDALTKWLESDVEKAASFDELHAGHQLETSAVEGTQIRVTICRTCTDALAAPDLS